MRAVFSIALGASLVACSNSTEFENRCRESARLIVHNTQLWSEYQAEAHETYLERANRYPKTEKSLIEYAPSFEKKFGARLSYFPEVIAGEVTREDLWVLKDGEEVAQYVNFYRGGGWPGYGGAACFHVYPELYSVQGRARN